MQVKKTWIRYSLAISVALFTFLIYLPALRNEFVNWDDNVYIVDNLFIRSFDLSLFRWAFFDFYDANWHPLTWISHALDYALWGLNPMGHHLTNIVLHGINAFLVVLLVMRLLASLHPDNPSSSRESQFALIVAGTTGLLFGIHPLHVESVAWVSERKDLLCALFFLLSIMTYAKYAIATAFMQKSAVYPMGTKTQTDSNAQPLDSFFPVPQRLTGLFFFHKHYLFAFGLFTLALLSKPMAVSLPLVLLILDWYPFGRIRSFKTLGAACIEKLPFIALSLVSSVVTVLAQGSGGALKSTGFTPLAVRILVGVKSLVVYLVKIILPLNLSPFYPYPKDASLFSLEYIAPIFLVSGITVISILTAKKRKLWLSSWGYYFITLFPVLGIVQVGGQSMADRYAYLPSLAPFLLIGLTAAGVWRKIRGLGSLIANIFIVSVSFALVASLSYASVRQISIWRNSIELLSVIIEKEPERIAFAYYNRGMTYERMDQLDKAMADYDKAIAVNPLYSEAYNNRGLVFSKMGRPERAVADYDRAIASDPGNAKSFVNRGILYFKAGQIAFAMSDFQKACDLGEDFGCKMLNYTLKMR